MKKIFTLLASTVLLAGSVVSANAAQANINFEDIAVGTRTVDTEYADLGVNWMADPFTTGSAVYNQVVIGGAPYFNSEFDPANQMLVYDGRDFGAPTEGTILLDSYTDYMSFQHRRPQSSGSFTLSFYDYTSPTVYFLLYTASVSSSGTAWSTFTYDSSYGDFNMVRMYSTNKFVIDDMAIGSVPIPPAFYLFGSGLLLVFRRRLEKPRLSTPQTE